MKTTLVTIVLTAVVTHAEAWEARKLDETDRKLGQFDFLISNASPEDEPMCMTAVDGMRNFGNLKLMPCDFDTYPPEQLWNYFTAKFFNDVGNANSKCMVVNHGESLFDGVRVRLVDCQDVIHLTMFIYDGEYIRVAQNTDFCLTNRGAVTHAGDTIHAKPCLDRPDFKWTHSGDDPRGTNLSFYADGGCIQPKGGSAVASTEIIMDTCDERRAWNVKEVNGAKIFRSLVDTSMCLQAGLGGDVKHGTKMRLMPCDANERLQRFEWSDEFDSHIKLADDDGFCLEWRGLNVNVGVDPVIMKACVTTVYEGWSGDEVY